MRRFFQLPQRLNQNGTTHAVIERLPNHIVARVDKRPRTRRIAHMHRHAFPPNNTPTSTNKLSTSISVRGTLFSSRPTMPIVPSSNCSRAPNSVNGFTAPSAENRPNPRPSTNVTITPISSRCADTIIFLRRFPSRAAVQYEFPNVSTRTWSTYPLISSRTSSRTPPHFPEGPYASESLFTSAVNGASETVQLSRHFALKSRKMCGVPFTRD